MQADRISRLGIRGRRRAACSASASSPRYSPSVRWALDARPKSCWPTRSSVTPFRIATARRPSALWPLPGRRAGHGSDGRARCSSRRPSPGPKAPRPSSTSPPAAPWTHAGRRLLVSGRAAHGPAGGLGAAVPGDALGRGARCHSLCALARGGRRGGRRARGRWASAARALGGRAGRSGRGVGDRRAERQAVTARVDGGPPARVAVPRGLVRRPRLHGRRPTAAASAWRRRADRAHCSRSRAARLAAEGSAGRPRCPGHLRRDDAARIVAAAGWTRRSCAGRCGRSSAAACTSSPRRGRGRRRSCTATARRSRLRMRPSRAVSNGRASAATRRWSARRGSAARCWRRCPRGAGDEAWCFGTQACAAAAAQLIAGNRDPARELLKFLAQAQHPDGGIAGASSARRAGLRTRRRRHRGVPRPGGSHPGVDRRSRRSPPPGRRAGGRARVSRGRRCTGAQSPRARRDRFAGRRRGRRD